MFENLNFSFPEILSLIGLTQCVYLLVYIGMRIKNISHAGLPFFYFLILGCAFFFDFGEKHIGGLSDYYYYLQWFAWSSLAPLSVLLIVQFSDLKKTPLLREYWVLLLAPLCFLLSMIAVDSIQECNKLEPCDQLKSIMSVTGVLAGAISLLVIFSKKDIFKKVRKQKLGKELYWLIFALIAVNTLLLTAMLAFLLDYLDIGQSVLIRTILGISFVYLVSTSLLRLYPKRDQNQKKLANSADFSEDELVLAEKIEHLINVEKVYQEPAYSRADLAKECGYSETIVSRVFNAYFQKSFPQMMNEKRVDEAKKLLTQTEESIKTISQEVGFNSTPTFNRVFKGLEGSAPSQYRKSIKT